MELVTNDTTLRSANVGGLEDSVLHHTRLSGLGTNLYLVFKSRRRFRQIVVDIFLEHLNANFVDSCSVSVPLDRTGVSSHVRQDHIRRNGCGSSTLDLLAEAVFKTMFQTSSRAGWLIQYLLTATLLVGSGIVLNLLSTRM